VCRERGDVPVDLDDEGGILGDLSGERVDLARELQGVLCPVGCGAYEESDEQLGHRGDQF